MIKKPLYVIVPVYKVEPYLHKCVDSILAQTYKDFELILVDDGSPDSCPSICDEYVKQDRRVTVIHKENGGLSSARNTGLDYIKDKPEGYVTFIDSDDWVDSDYFSALVNLMETNNVDIVCSSFFHVNGYTSKPFMRNTDIDKRFNGIKATELLVQDETVQSHAWSKMYKTHLFTNVRYDVDLCYMEDQATTFKLFYNSSFILITNYHGYYYNQDNACSLTRIKKDIQKVISALRAYYSVCMFPFKDEDRPILVRSANSALASAFLMLLPYCSNRKMNEDDKSFMSTLKNYVDDNQLVKKYIPRNKNEKIKKNLYLLCGPMYSYIFRLIKTFK